MEMSCNFDHLNYGIKCATVIKEKKIKNMLQCQMVDESLTKGRCSTASANQGKFQDRIFEINGNVNSLQKGIYQILLFLQK